MSLPVMMMFTIHVNLCTKQNKTKDTVKSGVNWRTSCHRSGIYQKTDWPQDKGARSAKMLTYFQVLGLTAAITQFLTLKKKSYTYIYKGPAVNF